MEKLALDVFDDGPFRGRASQGRGIVAKRAVRAIDEQRRSGGGSGGSNMRDLVFPHVPPLGIGVPRRISEFVIPGVVDTLEVVVASCQL